MIYDYITTKPPLDEDTLVHYGVKGMKWRHRIAGVKLMAEHAKNRAIKTYVEGKYKIKKAKRDKLKQKQKHDWAYGGREKAAKQRLDQVVRGREKAKERYNKVVKARQAYSSRKDQIKDSVKKTRRANYKKRWVSIK